MLASQVWDIIQNLWELVQVGKAKACVIVVRYGRKHQVSDSSLMHSLRFATPINPSAVSGGGLRAGALLLRVGFNPSQRGAW